MDIATNEVAQPPSEAAVATVRTSAAILGDIGWLMMESPWHRGRNVADFARLILPPIKHRQFRLFHDGHIPVAFISWALLSPEAEHRVLDDPHSIEPDDWMSGKATYLIDFIVTRNSMRKVIPYLRRDPLTKNGPIRGIRNRNNVRSLVEFCEDSNGKRLKTTRIA